MRTGVIDNIWQMYTIADDSIKADIQNDRNYYGKGTPAFEAYLKYTQWKKNNPHKSEYDYFKSL